MFLVCCNRVLSILSGGKMTRRDDDKSKSEERGREGGTGSFEIRPFFLFSFHFHLWKKKNKEKVPSPDIFIKHGALGLHSLRCYISRRFYTVDLRNKFRERFATLAAGRLWNMAGLGRRSTRGATGWKGINPPANSPPKIIHSGNTPRTHQSQPSLSCPSTFQERERKTRNCSRVDHGGIGERFCVRYGRVDFFLFQSDFLFIEIRSKTFPAISIIW